MINSTTTTTTAITYNGHRASQALNETPDLNLFSFIVTALEVWYFYFSRLTGVEPSLRVAI